jgi:hypothetical protein
LQLSIHFLQCLMKAWQEGVAGANSSRHEE